MITSLLAEFPGFAVHYDPAQKPYFEATLVADLRLLASKTLGAALLKAIDDARPVSRTPTVNSAKGIVFPVGANVMCLPTSMDFIPSGSKLVGAYDAQGKFGATGLDATPDPRFNPAGCRFYAKGGSYAEAGDPTKSSNGGTVSLMHYTNAQIFSQGAGDREIAYPHIVLAHELIHCLHHLLGNQLSTGMKDEELRTTGLSKWTFEKFSENQFRRAFHLELRNSY